MHSKPAYDPGRHCFYYPGFMVKEVDLGDMPVERLAIVSGKNPPCDAVNAKERDLTRALPDSRFVGAASRTLVFFDVDGHNGVVTFSVLDAITGRRLFEDAVEDAPGGTLPFTRARNTAAGFVLRYRRGYVAPCLIGGKSICWANAAAATGLGASEPAACRTTFNRQVLGKIDPASVQSVVFYDAEARYTRDRLSIIPRSGVLRCNLSD